LQDNLAVLFQFRNVFIWILTIPDFKTILIHKHSVVEFQDFNLQASMVSMVRLLVTRFANAISCFEPGPQRLRDILFGTHCGRVVNAWQKITCLNSHYF
jgi:hypothetical protein